MLTGLELTIRIIIAVLLGGMIGYERERNGQPVGIRTNIILVVAVTLITTLSIYLADQIRPMLINGDLSQVTVQVISGIGFLGAGTIVFFGVNIKGFTTATSLWAMTMVGLALGAGHYLQGAAGTSILLICLILLNEIKMHFNQSSPTALLVIFAEDRINLLDEVSLSLSKISGLTDKPWVSKNMLSNKIRIEWTVMLSSNFSVGQILETLIKIDGIHSVKIG
jgi:putative Mg2+ transporter-C (MgtC) family protein